MIREQLALCYTQPQIVTPCRLYSESIHISRGALPAHLPRVHVSIEPNGTVCPCCHGAMYLTGGTTSVLRRLSRAPPQQRRTVLKQGGQTADVTVAGTLR